MNVKELISAIMTSYAIKRPLLALSSPGIGKSSAVYQAAQKLGDKNKTTFSVIEVRGASSSPSELADIRYVDAGEVLSAEQAWLPTESKIVRGECSERGVIFLDELGDSLPAVQSCLQRLLLDRRLGGLTLAPGWHCVAASNRASDKAAAGRLSTALVNRCITVKVEPDMDVFIEWAIATGLHTAVIAFGRWRPNCIRDFDPTRKAENPAFCSPRSLHILSDLLDEEENPHFEMLTGTIGDGVGSEFSGFLRIMGELPDLNALLASPSTYPVPTKIDVAIATLYALIARVSDKTAGPILEYLTRNEVEIATCGLKDMIKIKKDALIGSAAFKKWASEPRHIRLLT